MNDLRSTDRLLTAWFESEAPPSAPEALSTDIHRATSRVRPRPGWLTRLRGTSMDVIEGGAARRGPRLAPALALLILLLIALLAAAALVGGRPPQPDSPAVVPSAVASTHVSPTARPSAPASPSPEPSPSPLADATFAFEYPVMEVIPGDDAMWVSVSGKDTQTRPRSIHRIDPGATTSTPVVDTIPAEGFSPVSMVQTTGSIWAVVNGRNEMVRLDATTGRLLGTIPVGEFPIEPAVGFGAVWSQDYRDGSVTKIDPTTGKVSATIEIAPFKGEGPRSIAMGKTLLWAVTPRQDILVGIDPAKNRVAKSIPLAANLHCGVAVVAGRVWVASCEPNPLQVFDEATGTPLPTTVTGGAPLFARGGIAWLPSYGERSTSFVPVDTTTLAIAPQPVVDLRVPAADGERSIGVGHGSLWYAEGLKVHRLSLDAFGSN